MRPQIPSNNSGNNNGSTNNVAQRKRRRGQIEKRRRDRINLTLIELRRLVPAASEKQGQAKMEKAEILRLTVDYIRELHMRGLGDNWNRVQSAETSEAAAKQTTPPIKQPQSVPQPQQQPIPQPQQQQHQQLQLQASTDQQIVALQSSSANMPPMQHQMQQLSLANQLEHHHSMAAAHHRANPTNAVVYPYHNHSCEPTGNAIPYYYF